MSTNPCAPHDEIAPGEVYTLNTIPVPGADATVVGSATGPDFQFKPLISGTGILITETPDAITITSTGATQNYTMQTLPGGDATLVDQVVGSVFQFRGLQAGTNITFDNINPNFLRINGPVYTYSSLIVPNASSIIAGALGNDLRFRPIIGTGTIQVDTTTTPNAITISSTAVPDTYSTLPVAGVAATVVATKVGGDFRFKGFIPGSGISISQTSSAITLSAVGYTFSDAILSGVSLIQSQGANSVSFRTLTAGTNISLDTLTTPGTIIINSNPPVYTLASNVVPGSDANINAAPVGNQLRLKPLNAGTNVTVEETTLPGAITINGPTYASNVIPSGVNITDAQVGNEFRFRSLLAGLNITLDTTTTPGAIIINATGGNVYTYSSNVVPGSDANITAAQVGNDFRFKPLNAGTNITVEETTLPGAITINGPTLASNIVAGSDANINAAQVGNEFRLKPLNAGTNITVEETTLPGAITINAAAYTLASNVVAGSDVNINASPVGNEFRLKPLNAGVNVTVEETTLPGAITINGPTLASNVVAGSDANINAAQVGNEFRLKPLNAGPNITIEETTLPGAITISAAAGNVYTLASNVVPGSDANINAAPVGNEFRLKPLNGGTNITVEETTLPGAITINGPTLASNVVAGSDVDINAAQVGNEFRLKPLNAGANVTIEETTLPGAITINAAPPNVYTYSSNVVAGSDANITAAQVGNDFRFKPLNAGTNVTIEETTLPGAITINAIAGGSGSLSANNTVFVDQQFGNNATGVRERRDLPFQTVSAALSASIGGDLIYILPGNYTTGTLNITSTRRFYIATGAVLTNSSTMFNCTGGELLLYGDGIFITSGGSLITTNPGVTNIVFQAHNVTVTGNFIFANTINSFYASINNLTCTTFINSANNTINTRFYAKVNNATSTSTMILSSSPLTLYVNINQATSATLLNIQNASAADIQYNGNSVTLNGTCIFLVENENTAADSNCRVRINIGDILGEGVLASATSNKTGANRYGIVEIIANRILLSSPFSSLSAASNFIITVNAERIVTGNFVMSGSNVHNIIYTVKELTYTTSGGLFNTNPNMNFTINAEVFNMIGRVNRAGIFNIGTLNFSDGQLINVTLNANIINVTNNNTLSSNMFQATNDGHCSITANTINCNTVTNLAIFATSGGQSTLSCTAERIFNVGLFVVGFLALNAPTNSPAISVKANIVENIIFQGGIGSINLDIEQYNYNGSLTETSSIISNGNVYGKINNILINRTSAVGFADATYFRNFYIGTMTINNNVTNTIFNSTRLDGLFIDKLIKNNTIPFMVTGSIVMTINYLETVATVGNFITINNSTAPSNIKIGTLRGLSGTSSDPFIAKNGSPELYLQIENAICTTNLCSYFLNTIVDTNYVKFGYMNVAGCGLVAIQTNNNQRNYINVDKYIGSASPVILNSRTGTLDITGNFNTTGANVIQNTVSGMAITLGASKLVSTGACITSSSTLNAYVVPSIAKNAPTGVNVIPGGLLGIGDTLFVDAGVN